MNGLPNNPGSAFGRFVSAVARFAIALVGAVVMVGALFIGLIVGLTLLIFALLRGRKPTGVKFMWRKGEWPGRPGRRQDSKPVEQGEVVDIEVREIPPKSPTDR